jgi:hypothetical protein
MNFRLELDIKPFLSKINLQDKILLIGSCFTDHISKRLAASKIQVLENPHGILFNPVSIATATQAYATNKKYSEADLFCYNELFTSWQHHGDFSHPKANVVLGKMNQAVTNAHQFLKETNWVIITLGSAWVYELANTQLGGHIGLTAANCHKVPQQHFNHRLLQTSEVQNALQLIVDTIKNTNPNAQIIFTISPVRHHREGLVENNRSKALLICAVHQIIEQNKQLHYFPSYELVIDDLRDYRFYAEDLVHPNHQATQYVWQKFVATCMDAATQNNMEEIAKLVHAKNHKPLHPDSAKHQEFLAKMLQKSQELQHQFPYLNFSEELQYFGE